VLQVAVAAFLSLLEGLANVRDPHQAEGKLYQLPHVLPFSILAIVTGCNSYRGIVTFIEVHRRSLNSAFALKWRRAPAHTAKIHHNKHRHVFRCLGHSWTIFRTGYVGNLPCCPALRE
jgi:hypothetical protein